MLFVLFAIFCLYHILLLDPRSHVLHPLGGDYDGDMYLIIGDSRIVGPVCDKNGVAYRDIRERECDHGKNNHNSKNCGEEDINRTNDNKGDYSEKENNNNNYDHNYRNSNIKNSKIDDNINNNIKVSDAAVSISNPLIINFDFLSFSSPPSTPTRTEPIKPVLTTIGTNQAQNENRDISDISVDEKKNFAQRIDSHKNNYNNDGENNRNDNDGDKNDNDSNNNNNDNDSYNDNDNNDNNNNNNNNSNNNNDSNNNNNNKDRKSVV